MIYPSEDVAKAEGKTPCPVAANKFTASQQAEIEKIMSDYLVAHPEILVKAGETLQAQQAAQRKVAMAQAAFENYTELTADPDTPSYGPADAKVVVVTFFDYQSVWSHRLSYEIDRVMKSNPDVRVAFKEWPILGARWPASVEAARTGLQIWYQKGQNAYLDYYHGLFAIGHTEGELTTADIRKVSSEVKLNTKKAKDVDAVLERNDILSHKVGFSGTPAVLVMPVVGGDVNTITVIPGYPSEGELQAAVKLAREGKKVVN
ncbi:DsbA family protein [Rahnella bruchi]|uniref:DsbA family protein n=1 Tax=Rahnella bruchi TaxID=1510573 RepID=UPI000EA0F3FA|nr:DsbA family protein [Rahnella bruchi]